jgi:hypothetical protein
MSKRLPCPPAPGPLEEYAARFDELFCTLAQRRGFREYLQGLLLPKDRNKTLTALAGTEPIVGAQGAPAQRLQFSSRSRIGMRKQSMPAAWSCSGKIRRRSHMRMASLSSMRPATVRTASRPLM